MNSPTLRHLLTLVALAPCATMLTGNACYSQEGPTKYTIHLVNSSTEKVKMWCFLSPPKELDDSKKVFANSSTWITIPAGSPDSNTFVIPVQYMAEASAGNDAVGLDIEIDSHIKRKVALKDTVLAKYYTNRQGPDLVSQPADPDLKDTELRILSNPFDKEESENNEWYNSQTFGMKTKSGFIGMTWSAVPNDKRTITPKLTFFVTTGDFGENKLADYNDVNRDNAAVSVPDDFESLHSTVTLASTGKWTVTPGRPKSK